MRHCAQRKLCILFGRGMIHSNCRCRRSRPPHQSQHRCAAPCQHRTQKPCKNVELMEVPGGIGECTRRAPHWRARRSSHPSDSKSLQTPQIRGILQFPCRRCSSCRQSAPQEFPQTRCPMSSPCRPGRRSSRSRWPVLCMGTARRAMLRNALLLCANESEAAW